MAKTDPAALLPGNDAKPANKLKLIVLIAVVFLLAIGGSVAGTWFFLNKGDAKAEESTAASSESATPQKQPALYEQLAPAFVVNYKQDGRQRYMQVSVALMARDPAQLSALKAHMPVLRNNLVMLFSGQDFTALTTPVGKEMLRQQATASVQELAKKETGHTVVEQVLFTNFVLQ
ncbi:flagellar basal body-associated protein FliL [Pseudomonas sp. LS44]|uniref:flagellar basal body-associated protein FliL n=1 Tax=Pseudomonas sp. LS44 TaxID=1357074 RepID=UPI00215AB432|nr:flagellar basal body-associated protein FliL [Pseudomonas sp. LS44]UVE16367.1 flagellar basal body-associated protein FliL [Pseudomonas sp. LS44]